MSESKEMCRYCHWVRRRTYDSEYVEEMQGWYYPVHYFCSLNPPLVFVKGKKTWSGLPQVQSTECCQFFRLRKEGIRYTAGWWCEDSQRLASEEGLKGDDDYINSPEGQTK